MAEPIVTEELDPVLHAPARLRIAATLAALQVGDSLSFPRLQQLLDLTPGNLITHLRKLESAGYVVTAKSGHGRSGQTSTHLTQAGRAALQEYSAVLHQLLAAVMPPR
jgi:DNA-binding MarR family transcriptional regulator